MYSTKKDTGNYVITKKYLDPDYIVQEVKMAKCISELTNIEYNRRNFIKIAYQNSAFLNERDKISYRDITDFVERSFDVCYGVVAEHKANKIVCKDFEIAYAGFDLIKQYALLEFTECVRQKNLDAKKPFELVIPDILEDVDKIEAII
ncbi:hypothetical protein BDAP_002462 [Binucleata daphniae]